jgi:hypothetical protein
MCACKDADNMTVIRGAAAELGGTDNGEGWSTRRHRVRVMTQKEWRILGVKWLVCHCHSGKRRGGMCRREHCPPRRIPNPYLNRK